MFRIGERVVHPMHGAGVIDSIVQGKGPGGTRDYYVFRLSDGDLILKIPVDRSNSVGLRPVITKEEAVHLLDMIPSLKPEEAANWNRRYRENLERLKSGDLQEVARVIKGLMRRDQLRGLSNGERKMLHNARKILFSELMLVQGVTYQEIEAQVDAVILHPQET